MCYMARGQTAKKQEVVKRNNVWELSEYARRELFDAKKKELNKYISKRKKQFIKELEKYEIIKSEDDDINIEIKEKTLPMIELSDFCFSPFVRVPGVVPDYSASEFSVIFDFFKECIKEMNKSVIIPPTKEQFCSLCGFSTSRFNDLKNTGTTDIREILLQVEDYICNYLSIGGLTRKISEVSSIFNQKVLGRKEAGDTNTPQQTNNIVIGDSAFNELCNKFGISEKR